MINFTVCVSFFFFFFFFLFCFFGYKINKIDNDLCSYCQKETESILHLLFGCDVVKEFWGSFKTWVMSKINTDVHLSVKI